MKKERRITIKELASLTGVSISTVSKALNDSNEISSKVKKKIKRAARSNNYFPSDIAQSLKSQRTKTIGVIVPNILDEFFAKVIHGIEKEARKKNYKVIICISNERLRNEVESVATLLKSRVDGLLISLTKQTQKRRKYNHLKGSNNQVPIVMFDRVCNTINCDKITIDDFNSAYKATTFLIQKGCVNIAFLSTISDTSVGKLREQGYLCALEEKGKNMNSHIITIHSYNHFKRALNETLENKSIDAVLAADELSAVYTMNIAQYMGLKIPTDFSVIGFTNGVLAKYSFPSLSTIDQHAENMGKMAVDMLMNRIENVEKGIPIHKVLQSTLVRRKST